MKLTLDLTTVADLKAQLRGLNDAMPLRVTMINFGDTDGTAWRASFEVSDGGVYIDLYGENVP